MKMKVIVIMITIANQVWLVVKTTVQKHSAILLMLIVATMLQFNLEITITALIKRIVKKMKAIVIRILNAKLV